MFKIISHWHQSISDHNMNYDNAVNIRTHQVTIVV